MVVISNSDTEVRSLPGEGNDGLTWCGYACLLAEGQGKGGPECHVIFNRGWTPFCIMQDSVSSAQSLV